MGRILGGWDQVGVRQAGPVRAFEDKTLRATRQVGVVAHKPVSGDATSGGGDRTRKGKVRPTGSRAQEGSAH